ncbi:hypothetical protein AMATHDRAFT_45185 [Amanita thiersii Skay4041]|uniref:Peptidase S8/S53 domain-containing protein n=1 Tax=Amanita thiersii Skay4041 TaxID=703135 RepID=A0A2A9NZW3_9AGAR|nr:hypothetical protein AMATHDRAFT_45185 [Amanita thiersii Skay4041]
MLLLVLLPYLVCVPFMISGLDPLSNVTSYDNATVVSNRFIITPNSLSRAYGIVRPDSQKRGIEFRVHHELSSEEGSSATLTNVTAVPSTHVVAVESVQEIQKLKEIPMKPPTMLTRRGKNAHTKLHNMLSTHRMTVRCSINIGCQIADKCEQGVDRLHAEGLTGKGIRIGILDSGMVFRWLYSRSDHSLVGIDKTHPLFRDKNIIVHDFLKQDPDQLDQCLGHGTSVAPSFKGIVGAKPDNELNIRGVAYDASLYVYRVIDCQRRVNIDAVHRALEQAARDDIDVLVLSFGSPYGWATSFYHESLRDVIRSGRIVVAAAGNDGSSGLWYTDSPGSEIDVISVAEVENKFDIYFPRHWSVHLQFGGVKDNPTYISYSSDAPLLINAKLDVFATSNACNPLPSETPNLSKYLVIVRMKKCPIVQMLRNIANKGGETMLIYGHRHRRADKNVGTYKAAFISASADEFLVERLSTNHRVSAIFPKNGGIFEEENPNGGLISPTSSYGPTYELLLKPNIAAPGGAILTTSPLKRGTYGIERGTSFAVPFVAGCVALLLQDRRKVTNTRNILELLETTGEPVLSSYNGTILQAATQQGAGLINCHNAVRYNTIVTPGELLLRDIVQVQKKWITIHNTGQSKQTYHIEHRPAGTAETFQRDGIYPAHGPVPLSTRTASVYFDPTSFTLSRKETKAVSVTFVPPKGSVLYSGFIMITSQTETLHVTYLGLGASIRDKKVLDRSSLAVIAKNGEPHKWPTPYTFVGGSVPEIQYRLAFGTPKLLIDLVKYDNRRPKDKWIVGNIVDRRWLRRSSQDPEDKQFRMKTVLEKPVLGNGDPIPDGDYRFLITAFHVTGQHPPRPEDVETWEGPLMRFKVNKS